MCEAFPDTVTYIANSCYFNYMVHVKQKIFITRHSVRYPSDLFNALTQKYQIDFPAKDGSDTWITDILMESIGAYDAILCRASDTITAPIIEAASKGRTRIIANYAVGVDNIDVAYAKERGIVVTNTPDVLTDAVAELTFMLLLSVSRNVGAIQRKMREAHFPKRVCGRDLYGKTLGLVGLGRIGRAVAHRAHAFGMNVVYYSPMRHTEHEGDKIIYCATLNELLATADIVSLHAPIDTAQKVPMIGAPELARMKEGAILLNTARGKLVDEQALIEILLNQPSKLWGVGLDVFQKEKDLPDYPVPAVLLDLFRTQERNVVLTSHIGSATFETRAEMGRMALENIDAVLQGRPPLNGV